MRTIFILIGNEVRRFLHDKPCSLAHLPRAGRAHLHFRTRLWRQWRREWALGNSARRGERDRRARRRGDHGSIAEREGLQSHHHGKSGRERELPLTEARVRERFRAGSRSRFALIFPPDAESDTSFGLKMKFLQNPTNEIETQTVTGLVQKTIYTSAPQALLRSLQKKATQFIGPGKTGALQPLPSLTPLLTLSAATRSRFTGR